MKIERCPDYCPFLEKDAVHCHLFDVHLVIQEFILKCPDCMNADVRKTQYQKKIKDFNTQQYLWDKALKRQPSKILQQVKTNWQEFKDNKEMREFFSALSGDIPIMLDKQTSKLLLALYMTLGDSEKMQMKEILNNPTMAELLLTSLKHIKSGDDLIKKVRGQIREIQTEHKKQNKMLRQKQEEKERS